MSIDWGKIEAKKEKTHKVPGTVLLEMKAKISSQEKEIAALRENVSMLSGKTDGLKGSLETTITEKDKQNKNLMDERNKLQSNLEGKISSLEGKIRELQSALDATKVKLAELEGVKKEKDELAKNVKILEDELQARDFEYFKKYIKEKSGRAAKTFEQKSNP